MARRPPQSPNHSHHCGIKRVIIDFWLSLPIRHGRFSWTSECRTITGAGADAKKTMRMTRTGRGPRRPGSGRKMQRKRQITRRQTPRPRRDRPPLGQELAPALRPRNCDQSAWSLFVARLGVVAFMADPMHSPPGRSKPIPNPRERNQAEPHRRASASPSPR
jgi:hypothetical protein